MTTLLRAVGFDVREAINGYEAIECFAEWEPAIILMDLAMPELDGYEAIRRIRSTHRGVETPIIAVSASAFEVNEQDAIEAGADAFVKKPIDDADLFAKLGALGNVRYVYGDPLSDTRFPKRRSSEALLSDGALDRLPEEMRSQMRDATITGDSDVLTSLIDALGAEDESLASALREVADRFEYDALLNALTSNKGAKE